jgi:hypothetical protein
LYGRLSGRFFNWYVVWSCYGKMEDLTLKKTCSMA